MSEKEIPSYIINLDPAVATVPYTPNIDIRNSLNFKDVMSKYNLGPNGAILTSLNLFSTKFDQVIDFVEKKAPNLKYIFVDTPGQMEAFSWSASGTIITETFASSFPTIFIYVIDTTRCTNPTTFMSNMLHACSILYKTRLPLLITFNKSDVTNHEFCLEWMKDEDVFEDAVRQGSSYMSNLTHSMSLVLQEFYHNLTAVGISSVTGSGFDDLFNATIRCALQYNEEYKVELEAMRQKKVDLELKRQKEELEKVKKDVEKQFDKSL